MHQMQANLNSNRLCHSFTQTSTCVHICKYTHTHVCTYIVINQVECNLMSLIFLIFN